jgi:ribbon-helix-helix CopG family protein
MTPAHGIRIDDELAGEISREAEARGVSWSAMIIALLTEALKMRRVPGIVMVDGPTGRRAVVAGSGLMSGKSSRRGRPAGKMSGNWRRTIPG